MKEGDLVRHKILGYIGLHKGTTKIRRLFEDPSSSYEIRVDVPFGKDKQKQIASPKNLEKLENLSLEERHKANLEFFNLPWKGVRKMDFTNMTYKSRSTHCWFCRADIDNATNLECVSCNWILCDCGACGCGYTINEYK